MTATPKAGRARARLTEDRIVQAALELCETAEGLNALTVRSLANHLGAATMTLYGYFRSKEEILDAVADHVMGGFVMEPVEGESPEEAVRAVADGLLGLMKRYPSICDLLGSRTTKTKTSMRGAMESVLSRLTEAGIPGPAAVRCYGFLMHHTMGFVAYQRPRPWGGDDTPAVRELRRQQQHFYAALPVDELPVVVGLAEELVVLPGQELYDYAVDLLVRQVLDDVATGA